MYSYQHRYHAGNLADVHKHLILCAILNALKLKDSPFCVLDAFAGEGIYDLSSIESLKTQEHKEGIMQMRDLKDQPPLLKELTDLPGDDLYHGSPSLIARKLRAQDRAIFVENHPQAYPLLKRNMRGYQNVHLHQRDAFEALQGLLPFKEKRGLILIDPSYELKEEYHTVPAAILKATKAFRQGIYMVWYPILSQGRQEQMVSVLKNQKHPNFYVSEVLFKDKPRDYGMYGSGVIVLNLPFAAQKPIDEALARLMR